MRFLRAGNGFVHLPENDGLILAHKRPAVKRRAAKRRHDRRAGIRLGDNIRQLQNALAEQRMLVRDDLPDLVDHSRHGIHGVDALFWIGGMAADTFRFDDDLRPAALAALDGRACGLADDDKIGLCQPRNFAGGHALEPLLMHRARHADAARKVSAGLFSEARRRRDHGAVAALHVGRAAAVNFPVRDLAAERVMLPLRRVDHVHGVDMAVHQDGLAGPFAVDRAEDAAEAVDDDLVEAVFLHFALHQLRHALFLSGIAGNAQRLLTKRNQLFICISIHAVKILSLPISV